ncbi:MAG: xylulokinase [Cetobacterium sp.]|uniref:xylulokinase n=2 Tax=Cetobacterium sp. TaxID=2071632 RepID=UPI003F2B4251
MYLGIDLGTSAVKLLLLDKNGKIVKTVSKEYGVNYLNSNWAEQNPEEWWSAVCHGLKDILDENIKEELKSISFSGQMHGLVILDEEDKVIRPAIIWCDQRTEKECMELNSLPWLGKVTGNQALTGFTAPKILWLKNNEYENFQKIKKIMLPKDYIAYKFSKIHGIDVSDASGTLILNVLERKWAKEMIEYLGIREENLGKVFESMEVIGNIDKEIATSFGINENVKIVIGGGDQAVGAVGVGAIKEGIISVALGTSGVVFSSTDEYRADKNYRLHSFCDANGKYHQMGVMLSAAGAFKWWVEDVNESKDYKYYNEIAEKIEVGSKGLFFMPYLIGERTPHNDSNIRGSFIGLTHNHKKGEMTRAVLEGVAFALRDSFELLKEMDIKIEKIRVSGGGAKSRLWKEILADVLGKKVVSIDSAAEGPALGAAILAAVGAKKYKSIEEACKEIINEVETCEPNLDNVIIYDREYKKFKRLYPMLKEFYL